MLRRLTLLTATVIAIAFVSFDAFAGRVDNVEVFGNVTFKDETVIRMSGLEQDPNLSAAEVRKRLQTSNIFTEVTVVRDESQVSIYVREKATWFIVPYFSKDSVQTIFGIAFGKYTFFGQDANILGRYQKGTDNQEASLLFRDETLFDHRWVLGASLDFEDSLRRTFEKRVVSKRTENQYHGGSLQVTYRISPLYSLHLNNYIERHRFAELDGQIFSGLQWSSRLIAEYNGFFIEEGLSEGLQTRLFIERTNPLSDFQFFKVGTLSQAGLFRHGNLNWVVRAKAEWGPHLPRYQLMELGGGRLRGFPAQQFRDNFYGKIQNDFLFASLGFWKLHFRPLIYTDWAFIQNSGRLAAGSGFQVFLREVAIPAVQFFVGYGFNPNGFQASASIGPQL